MAKKFLLTIALSVIHIVGIQDSARSTPCSEKTQCTQCFLTEPYVYSNTQKYVFHYNCCGEDFTNCVGWSWNYFESTYDSMSACKKARDSFGCNEYCYYDQNKERDPITCPSHKK